MAIKHLRTAFASQYQPGQPARLVTGEALQEPWALVGPSPGFSHGPGPSPGLSPGRWWSHARALGPPGAMRGSGPAGAPTNT